ncbi:hypothetical protein NDA14_006275 [Ustilago hordei]|nr:uncharacterized protein UHO2_05072 [Ustilago hordei]KAJ1043077.1 hypothetical protein NDA10_006624 [Ustilago hordei]KAJ1571302.1 hypothetical protein NDA12_005541 [Ustilago hordei]KAJ1571518.1 hypothetical protein NDA15_004751 [Ustilago hordei]KAJ1596758.1 hypothetical protein NDA14_006275 [Ustilago hordei]UTT90272.1 hypothetical protein NDA17_002882 [Ustilago hordei]
MALPPKLYTWLCGCFAALGSILFGYDLGVIAGVIVSPDFLRVTNNPSADYIGFIVSSMLLGAFVGCIPASLIADAFSRRFAIMVGAIIFILGGILQTAAANQGMMMAGRFFAGVGIGMLSLLAPLYQSEIAHPSIRGRLTTLQQFFLGIGALIASFVVYGCSIHQAGTVFEWRFPLGLQIAPAVPLAFLIMLFPESPRWLMTKGREEDALRSLARLHARGDTSDVFVRAELAEIKAQLAVEKGTASGWSEIFSSRQNIRKVAIGVILQFSVQITGVAAIQYYAPDIFKVFGYSNSRIFLLQSINSIIALIGEAACVLFVDKLGRRWPLIVCNSMAGACFSVATALQAVYPAAGPNPNKHAGGAFIAMIWIFNFFFSAGIGPLSWAVPVEIMNTSIRAKGTALTSISCWVANFMIGQVTPKALASIGWKYYLLFAIGGFTNALTFYLILPETKGRTLEEMDAFFERTPFIVAFTDMTISDKEREEQLRRGVIHAPQGEFLETGSHEDKYDGLKTSSHDHDVEKH